MIMTLWARKCFDAIFENTAEVRSNNAGKKCESGPGTRYSGTKSADASESTERLSRVPSIESLTIYATNSILAGAEFAGSLAFYAARIFEYLIRRTAVTN